MTVGLKLKAKMTSSLSSKWYDKRNTSAKVATLRMATDIHQQAGILAPVDTGALVNSGRIEAMEKGYKVSFGGEKERVRYARIQELGGTIKQKTRVITIKGTHYLKRAGENVMKNEKKYLRDA